MHHHMIKKVWGQTWCFWDGFVKSREKVFVRADRDHNIIYRRDHRRNWSR